METGVVWSDMTSGDERKKRQSKRRMHTRARNAIYDLNFMILSSSSSIQLLA